MKQNVTLEVSSTERVGALGKTGSGKSFLMLRLVSQLESVVIIDTKREIRIPNFLVTNNPKLALSADRIIYRPGANVSEKALDEFLGKVWRKYGNRAKRNMVVYIDEAAHVTSAARIGSNLKLLLQAGRSVGIGVWWSGQQVVSIHNTLISQSEKIFIFKLPVESDRQKLAGVIGGIADLAGSLENYEFIAYGIPEVEGIESDEGIEAYYLTLDKDVVNGRADNKNSNKHRKAG